MTEIKAINYKPLKDMERSTSKAIKTVFSDWRLISLGAYSGASLLAWLALGRYEFMIILPVLMCVAVAYYAQNIKNNAWIMFAIVNNWDFDTRSDLSIVIPPSLQVGHSQTLSPIIQANIGGTVCDLVSYTYSIGEKESAETFNFTIATTSLPLQMPHILLLSKKSSSGIQRKMPDGQELKLEGDFGKYFDLQIESGQQVNVLKLITPDVMRVLVDYGHAEDIEIIGYNAYFITKSDIRNFRDMPGLLNSVNALVGQLTENHALASA